MITYFICAILLAMISNVKEILTSPCFNIRESEWDQVTYLKRRAQINHLLWPSICPARHSYRRRLEFLVPPEHNARCWREPKLLFDYLDFHRVWQTDMYLQTGGDGAFGGMPVLGHAAESVCQFGYLRLSCDFQCLLECHCSPPFLYNSFLE
jgi:hypothetical protein